MMNVEIFLWCLCLAALLLVEFLIVKGLMAYVDLLP